MEYAPLSKFGFDTCSEYDISPLYVSPPSPILTYQNEDCISEFYSDQPEPKLETILAFLENNPPQLKSRSIMEGRYERINDNQIDLQKDIIETALKKVSLKINIQHP